MSGAGGTSSSNSGHRVRSTVRARVPGGLVLSVVTVAAHSVGVITG